MKILFKKDKNRRYIYFLIEKKMIILKYIIQNTFLKNSIRNFAYQELGNLIKENSCTKITNRCVLTNRGRAVFRKFKVSRIAFKKYALQGHFIGVKKASW